MLRYVPQDTTRYDRAARLRVVAKSIDLVRTMFEFGVTSLLFGSHTAKAHVILSLSTSADPEQVKPLHCSLFMHEGGLSLAYHKSGGRVHVNGGVALTGTHILIDGDLVEFCGSSLQNEYSIKFTYEAFPSHVFKSLLTLIRQKKQEDEMEQDAGTPTPEVDDIEQVNEEEEEAGEEEPTQSQPLVVPSLVSCLQLEERADEPFDEGDDELPKSRFNSFSRLRQVVVAPVANFIETSGLVIDGASAAFAGIPGLGSLSTLANSAGDHLGVYSRRTKRRQTVQSQPYYEQRSSDHRQQNGVMVSAQYDDLVGDDDELSSGRIGSSKRGRPIRDAEPPPTLSASLRALHGAGAGGNADLDSCVSCSTACKPNAGGGKVSQKKAKKKQKGKSDGALHNNCNTIISGLLSYSVVTQAKNPDFDLGPFDAYIKQSISLIIEGALSQVPCDIKNTQQVLIVGMPDSKTGVGSRIEQYFDAADSPLPPNILFVKEALVRTSTLAIPAKLRPAAASADDAETAAQLESETIGLSDAFADQLAQFPQTIVVVIDDMATTGISLAAASKVIVSAASSAKVTIAAFYTDKALAGIAVNTMSKEASEGAMEKELNKILSSRPLKSVSKDAGYKIYLRTLEHTEEDKTAVIESILNDITSSAYERGWASRYGPLVLRDLTYTGQTMRELEVRLKEEDNPDNTCGLVGRLPRRFGKKLKSMCVLNESHLNAVAKAGKIDIAKATDFAELFVYKMTESDWKLGGANCIEPNGSQDWRWMVTRLRSLVDFIALSTPGSSDTANWKHTKEGSQAYAAVWALSAVDVCASDSRLLVYVRPGQTAKQYESVLCGLGPNKCMETLPSGLQCPCRSADEGYCTCAEYHKLTPHRKRSSQHDYTWALKVTVRLQKHSKHKGWKAGEVNVVSYLQDQPLYNAVHSLRDMITDQEDTTLSIEEKKGLTERFEKCGAKLEIEQRSLRDYQWANEVTVRLQKHSKGKGWQKGEENFVSQDEDEPLCSAVYSLRGMITNPADATLTTDQKKELTERFDQCGASSITHTSTQVSEQPVDLLLEGVVGSPAVLHFEEGRRVFWYAKTDGITRKVYGHMVSETPASGQLAESMGISGTIKCKPEDGGRAKMLEFGLRVSQLFLAPEESAEEAMAADEAGNGDSEEDASSDHDPQKRSRDPGGGGPGLVLTSSFAASASAAASAPASAPASSASAAAAPAQADGESSPEMKKGKWSREEDARFEAALRLYGRVWGKVAVHVRTRTCAQCTEYGGRGAGVYIAQRVLGT